MAPRRQWAAEQQSQQGSWWALCCATPQSSQRELGCSPSSSSRPPMTKASPCSSNTRTWLIPVRHAQQADAVAAQPQLRTPLGNEGLNLLHDGRVPGLRTSVRFVLQGLVQRYRLLPGLAVVLRREQRGGAGVYPRHSPDTRSCSRIEQGQGCQPQEYPTGWGIPLERRNRPRSGPAAVSRSVRDGSRSWT